MFFVFCSLVYLLDRYLILKIALLHKRQLYKRQTSVIPNSNDKIKLWKRFVDDTFCFAKSEYTNNMLLALNSFHQNIKFTIETEKDDAIPFLDVLIIRKARKIETTVYRKKTCTDLYMNWYSHAPNNWKWGTLRTLVRRAHVNCSTKK